MSFTVQGLAEVSQLATSSSWWRPNKKCFVEPVSSKVDTHLIFLSKGTISRIQNVRSTLVETISIVWREWKIDCLEWVRTSWPEWKIIFTFKSQIEPTVVSNVTLNSGPWTYFKCEKRDCFSLHRCQQRRWSCQSRLIQSTSWCSHLNHFWAKELGPSSYFVGQTNN